jgi:hypothetical protein
MLAASLYDDLLLSGSARSIATSMYELSEVYSYKIFIMRSVHIASLFFLLNTRKW